MGTYFDGTSSFVNGNTAEWAGDVNWSATKLTTPYTGMPSHSAMYTLNSPQDGPYPKRPAVLLVPPTQTLWLGFSGSSTGDAGVFYQTVYVDGSVDAPRRLTLLSPSGTTRLNTSFNGATVAAVLIHLNTTSNAESSVTINSGTAVYAKTGTPPTLTGAHVPGEGHTGLRFSKPITRTYTQKRPDGRELITAATTLTEIGAWL
jgi:hypothetical protein